MSESNTAAAASPSFGALLRSWRRRRRYTQASLALEAEVSTRHLSYLENGRAKPSREMIAVLTSVLDVPLLHRNEMLLSAGLAPQYPSTELQGHTARHVRSAVEFLLVRHHPYPTLLVDEAWNLVMANDAYMQLACFLRGAEGPPSDPRKVHRGAPLQGSNALLPLFEEESLRRRIRNLPEFASMVLAHVHLAARTHARAKEVESRIRMAVGLLPSSTAPFPPVIPLCLDVGGEPLTLFSIMTRLGTSADVVLSSVRVETQFPADTRSDALLRQITAAGDDRASPLVRD